MLINTKKKIPKKRVFGYVDEAVVFGNFWNTKSHRAVSEAALQGKTWTSQSERRHAIEMKIGPLWAAVAFILVHLWAVAVLVCALWRFIGIVLTYLLILLLLFNESLWRGLCCTAVTLVSRSISKGSIHLLLKNMRQGVQWDAALRGWVVERVVAV